MPPPYPGMGMPPGPPKVLPAGPDEEGRRIIVRNMDYETDEVGQVFIARHVI